MERNVLPTDSAEWKRFEHQYFHTCVGLVGDVGEIDDPDGVGEVGNPVCGDMMTFYIKVKDNRLEDVKFKTFGCGAAIAVSSMVSEMAIGKTLEEAMKITPQLVADELEGLPKNKFHCSNLGAQALHKAIEDYQSKKKAEGGKK